MLIVSNFHDFYDPISAQGIDKTIIYQRVPKTIGDGKRRYGDYCFVGRKRKWNYMPFVVGFCGVMYPGVRVTEDSFFSTTKHFYNLAEFEAFLDAEEIADKPGRYWYHTDTNMTYARTRAKHFDPKTHEHMLPLFYEHKAPLFISWSGVVEFNEQLKAWGFQRVVDPYMAFQGIAMYISGVLGVDARPMVELSDKDRAAKAGHDSPMSFRKPKGKRGKPEWR